MHRTFSNSLASATRQRLSRRVLAVSSLLVALGLGAQTTDIANSPLVTTSSTSVLPNILFILDDSGSMGSTYMPDDANDFRGDYGYASSQCNGVYYDPTITYNPPVYSDGTSYPNQSFTAARNNGFSGTSSTNLSTNFNPGDGTSNQAAYYYRYSGTQTTARLKNYFDTNSTFYRECISSIGSLPGSAVFTKVVVGASEQQNFANWFSYYRTRMLMAKTASGFAFKGIDSRYRVAYMTINNNVSSSWLNFAPFDAAQKAAWYGKLYGAVASNSTPLRQALSNAGQIYAGKITSLYGTTVNDPIQYSCQQNFTILTTDGYWNGNAGAKLDGSAIGNEDTAEPRPRFDGATPAKTRVVTTTVTTTPTVTTDVSTATQVIQRQASLPSTVTTVWTRTLQTVGTAVQNASASNPTACVTDGGQNSDSRNRPWCITTLVAPSNAAQCTVIGSGNIRVCRGTGNPSSTSTSSNTPGGGAACQTDGAGNKWCVYPNNSTTGTSSCARVLTSPANPVYYCRAAAPTYIVTSQPQRYSQVVSRSTDTFTRTTNVVTSTTVRTVNAIATRVVTTIDGVVQTDVTTPTSSTVGPTTTTNTVNGSPVTTSGPTTTQTGDTGAPTGGTTWANNGTATNATTATIPTAPGTSLGTTPVPGAAGSPANGTTTTTTLSDVTTTVVTPTATTNPTPTVTSNAVTSTIPAIAGSTNSLSDVAQYYYVTDLRTTALSNATGALGADVTENNVPSSGQDAASWQHMTTFTLGIGALGRMVYSPTYDSDASGDFFDVRNGSIANPGAGICRWQSAGSICNWPLPAADQPETIDDLWHAAVNGRGGFFAASNPTSMANGIANALAGVSARTGSSAAATTSNPNVTSGDNFVFESTFTTNDWTGEVVRKQLDLSTGVVSASSDWQALSQLNSNTSRTLYTRNAAAANGLKTFDWASLTAAERAFFELSNISTLSQFCASGATCLSAGSKADAAGQKLVEFLTGSRTNEGLISDISTYYRQRAGLLGDIVSAEAVFVRKSQFNYGDTGYATFRAANESRQGMVYVASNDGMLHAFNADTGAEVWAYVPALVLPNLYKLADKNYANLHQYFLDGTPTVQDVYDGTAWRTILVAGMNAGGRGYYALDITDPANPKSLWEYTNNNLGFTFGNPEIVKLKNPAGTWAVIFGSGYNNVSPGDGVGRLFIINAVTGALIRTISTAVGSSTQPSGLSRIRAWVNDADADNTAERIYGGDLLGNLWRFDINNEIGVAGFDAHRLVTFLDPSGVAQPITSRPDIGELDGRAIILVGTGRYLGTSDLANTQRQTFYATKDSLGTSSFDSPRTTGSGFKAQVQTQTTCPATAPTSVCRTGQVIRTSTDNPVDFATDSGWYVDLIDSGERASTDVQLAFGTVVFNTNVPNASACTVGGYSNRYFLDFRTGGVVTTAAGVAGVRLGNALATRPVIVRLPNNTIVALSRLSDGTTMTTNVPIGPAGGTARRVSWRELVDGQQ